MKIYLSADIEGTAGIVDWKEASADHPQYAYFQRQMTREVAAACQGALEAGAHDILVRDAHDSARNIIPTELPQQTRLFRGWSDGTDLMMACLDESFDAVLFTGYHAAAYSDGNPLSHTMSLKVQSLRLNGRLVSEFDINAMIAASRGVPVYFLSGDAWLCHAAKEIVPSITTVATNEGFGAAAITMHPDIAVKQIRDGVKSALKSSIPHLYPMPERFQFDICYKEHVPAKKAACYPGVQQLDAKTVVYETADFHQAITALFWIL